MLVLKLLQIDDYLKEPVSVMYNNNTFKTTVKVSESYGSLVVGQ